MADKFPKIGDDFVNLKNALSGKGDCEPCDISKGLCGNSGTPLYLDKEGKKIEVDKKTGRPKDMPKVQKIACEWKDCQEDDKHKCVCVVFGRELEAKKDTPYTVASAPVFDKKTKRTEVDKAHNSFEKNTYRCFCIKPK